MAPRPDRLTPPSEHMPIGRLLSMTSKALRSRADEILAPYDASLTTWIVLQAGIDAPPEGLSQRRLAEGMGIGGPALVRHIDRFEKEGLVQRRRDERDRRITRITITTEGRRTHRRLKKVMDEHDGRLRAQIDPADAAAFERVLWQLHTFATDDPPHREEHMRKVR